MADKKMADHYELAYNTAANKLIRAAMAIQAITQEHGGDGLIIVQNNNITVHISPREPQTTCEGNPVRVTHG